METNYKKGKTIRTFLRRTGFMAIGVAAFANPLDIMNLSNIGFGLVAGLVFGGLFRLFLHGFLRLINGKLRKEKGKHVIRYAVDTGMLFLLPFVCMLLIAVFYLHWSVTLPFISAGIMAVGTAASIEIGKIQGKAGLKNTIATAMVSFGFSLLWTTSFPYLTQAPAYVEAGIQLIQTLIGGGL